MTFVSTLFGHLLLNSYVPLILHRREIILCHSHSLLTTFTRHYIFQAPPYSNKFHDYIFLCMSNIPGQFCWCQIFFIVVSAARHMGCTCLFCILFQGSCCISQEMELPRPNEAQFLDFFLEMPIMFSRMAGPILQQCMRFLSSLFPL